MLGAAGGVEAAICCKVLQTNEIPKPSDLALIENERNTIAVFEAAAPATIFVTQTRQVQNWSEAEGVN